MANVDPAPAPRAAPRTDGDRASHLAFVAHEIRNPLATALWSAELLAKLAAEQRGGPRGEKLAGMCLRALGRVRRLVEDHLLAERLDARGVPVALDAVPAADLVPPDASALGAAALGVELEPGLAVATDAILARRVLEATALAAARGGAEVRLRGQRVGRVARFRVEGAPAVPEDLSDRGRGDGGDGRGTALGLAMARRAVAALSGSLSVVDGAFVVDLPALDPDGGPA